MDEWLVDPMSSHDLFMTYPHTNQDYLYPVSNAKPLYNLYPEKNNNIQSPFTNMDLINIDNLIMILLTILIIFSSLIYRTILNIDKNLKQLIYKNIQ